MKCQFCNSEWSSTVQTKTCPFCGKDLITDEKMDVKSAIKKVIADRGVEILHTPKLIISYVMDYVQGYDREKKLLKIAINSGVWAEFAGFANCNNTEEFLPTLKKAKYNLMENEFLSEEKCSIIIDILMDVMGVSIADLYTNGDVDFSKLKGDSEFLRQEAFAGNPIAQKALGLCYVFGEGVEKNDSEARKWFERSAEQGYANAQSNLGYMYYQGRGGKQDYTEAAKYFKLAAEQNHAIAQRFLGEMYSEGLGVEHDSAQAFSWYKMAAEQNDSEAQFRVGGFYFNGTIVEQDYNKALYWYEKSAQQGHSASQFVSGVIYHEGLAGEKDVDKALKYYKLAAEQGNEFAQVELGRMYYDGDGVKQNYAQAQNS